MKKIDLKDLMVILLFITVIGMFGFSSLETVRHFTVLSDFEEVNIFGVYVVFIFMGIIMYVRHENIGTYYLVALLFPFLFTLGAYFLEINTEKYKKIENIDKETIKSVIGERTYVNEWDYLNILEKNELKDKEKITSLNHQELKESRNKVTK